MVRLLIILLNLRVQFEPLCYIPDFSVECCNCGVGYRTLRLRIMYGFDDEMYDIVD